MPWGICTFGVRPSFSSPTEISLADAMRFKGAAPEIINCRQDWIHRHHALSNPNLPGHLILWPFSTVPLADNLFAC